MTAGTRTTTGTRRAAWLPLVVLLGLLAPAAPAAAQVLEPPELTLRPPQGAAAVAESRRLYEEAWALHGRMLFEQALERLRAAYQTYRDPRLLLAMGRAAQMIPGQAVDAVQYYEAFGGALERIARALDEERPTSDERRRAVEEDRARLAEYRENLREGLDEVLPIVEMDWGRVPVDVSPADAAITWSGQTWPPIVANQPHRWVPLGTYLLEVSAAGHAIHRQHVTVQPDTPPLVVKLVRTPDARTGDIRVRCAMPGCRVTIRGEDATSALQVPYVVAPGTYDVVITAPGVGDVVRTVSVDVGQSVPIVVGPPPGAEQAVALVTPPPPASVVTTGGPGEPEPEWSRTDTAWTLVGAGGALLISAAVMHGVAWERASAVNERDVRCRGCLDAARGDYDAASDLYTGAIVGYSVGAASAAAGAVLLLLDPEAPAIGGAPVEGGGVIHGMVRF